MQVLHIAVVLQVALDHQQPLRAGRNHRALLRLFARQGNVRQLPAATIQIPVAGLAQRLAHVIDQESLALRQRHAVRPLVDFRQGDDTLGRIDCRDVPPRGEPRAEGYDFHVAAGPLGPHFVARVAEAIVPLAAALFGRRNLSGNRIIAVPGQTGSESPLIVHEKLGERPFPSLDVGQQRVPAAVGAHLPGVEFHSAAEHGPFLAVGLVNDRHLGRAGILRPEVQRLWKRSKCRREWPLRSGRCGRHVVSSGERPLGHVGSWPADRPFRPRWAQPGLPTRRRCPEARHRGPPWAHLRYRRPSRTAMPR